MQWWMQLEFASAVVWVANRNKKRVILTAYDVNRKDSTQICALLRTYWQWWSMCVQKVHIKGPQAEKILLLYARMKYLRWKLYAFVVKAWAEIVCFAKTLVGWLACLRITKHK